MPRHVGLVELEEREVVLAGYGEEMLRRALRRNDRDVGVAVLYRLAREVLHDRGVVHKVLDGGDRLRRREGHDGRHRLESAHGEFVDGIHQIRVGEADLEASLPKLEEQIVLFYDLPQRRTGEALAVPPHRLCAVDAREHRRLAGG